MRCKIPDFRHVFLVFTLYHIGSESELNETNFYNNLSEESKQKILHVLGLT